MISKDHFLRGVWGKNEPIAAPLRINPNTLYKTIHSLEEKKVIFVYPVNMNGKRHLTTIYEIAIDFIVTLRPSETDMNKLRQPRIAKHTAEIIDFATVRREKLGGFVGTNQYQPPAKLLVPTGTINIIKEKQEDNELVADAAHSNEDSGKLRIRRKPRSVKNEIDCNASARDVISVTIARATKKLDEKAAQAARGGEVTLSALNATWKKAMVAAYGQCTIAGLTTKEFGIFRRVIKAHELSCTWLEFFTWAINNWQRLNRESREFNEYKRKKDGDWSLKQEDIVFLGSETPDLFMLVKNFAKLLKRYSQHTLTGKATGGTEDVAKLKAELAIAQKEARTNASLLRQALSARGNPDTVRQKAKTVKTINPETDDFFDQQESSMPEWK
jgi:hypothetical protein